MTSRQLQALHAEECLGLIARSYIGRLAFVSDDGRPEILPFNYCCDDGTVVFRTGSGRLVDVIRGEPVAFEVDHFDITDHSGWSVVMHGTAGDVGDAAELDRLRMLPLRPWAGGIRDRYVRIVPTGITGRRIGLPPL